VLGCFRRWRYSSKDVRHKSPLKFTWANIRHYCIYVSAVLLLDVWRLKFLDEASFESRALRRKRGIARAGVRVGSVAHDGVSLAAVLSLKLTNALLLSQNRLRLTLSPLSRASRFRMVSSRLNLALKRTTPGIFSS
jgi:hypothetical protein